MSITNLPVYDICEKGIFSEKRAQSTSAMRMYCYVP